MFDLIRLPKGAGTMRQLGFNPNLPSICEGVEAYDVLCPVSKKSGLRENPLSLLSRVLDPSKVRQLDAVLQEIPSVTNEDGRISDDDALDLIVSRLSTGSRAEDALMRERLSSVLDSILPPEVRQASPETIQFDSTDAPEIAPNS